MPIKESRYRSHFLLEELIKFESVTPDNTLCQAFIAQQLTPLGFTVTSLPYGKVNNMWARWGNESPLLVFAGHTDVVPPGPSQAWHSPPFQATEREGYLYGRGAIDMKGSIAAMITACETFMQRRQPKGSIAFLITGDEEGPAIDGTEKVVAWLGHQGITIDYCLVGEPSSTRALGDTLRIGRRGSLNATLTLLGRQGHTAFPELAVNPIHEATPFLQDLQDTVWDSRPTIQHYPPTHLQIANIQAGAGATNVIPGELTLTFNIRYAPPLIEKEIKNIIIQKLKNHKLKYDIAWQRPSLPFYTAPDDSFIQAGIQAVQAVTGLTPALSTGGGTSDGRFIAPTGAKVMELGLCNATIHQTNECVQLTDLQKLSEIYEDLLGRIL